MNGGYVYILLTVERNDYNGSLMINPVVSLKYVSIISITDGNDQYL